jgi:hypothetical protein
MMSCAESIAWSHPVLSYYCTEHAHQRGVILSSRITAIAMSRSGQLGRRCTITRHCSTSHDDTPCSHVLQAPR